MMQKRDELMQNLNELNSFLQTNFEITQGGVGEKDNMERVYFWDNIYVPRANEGKLFNNFLKEKGVPLLLITGQVGTGKTTFIQDKIESPRHLVRNSPLCNGIRIDLQKYPDDIRAVKYKARNDKQKKTDDDDDNEFRLILQSHFFEFLNYKISSEVKEHFIRHFSILGKNNVSKELLFNDVSHRPHLFGLENITLPEAVNLKQKAKKHLAAAVIISKPDSVDTGIFEKAKKKFFENGKDYNDSFEQFEIVSKYLEEENIPIDDLIKIDGNIKHPSLAVHWLSIYANFFEKQAILFIDNGDSILDSFSNQNLISEYAYVLSYSLSEKKYKDKSPLKIILSLRDENVKMAHPAADRTRKPKTISLAYVPFGSEEEYDSKPLPLDLVNIGDIIDRRLNFCKKILNSSLNYDNIKSLFLDFRYIIINLWANYLDETEKNYRTWERIDLVNICNGSIRICLDMARFTSIKILKELNLKNLNVFDIQKPYFKIEMKSRVINWFFTDVAGQNIKEYIRTEIQQVREQKKICCTHRIILSFLYNKFMDSDTFHGAKIKYSNLYSSISDLFSIDEKFIKETLFFLYNPGDVLREFVSIEQSQPLEKSKDIDSSALIYINQRGIVLISRIMQTIDYWYRLIENRKQGMSNSIFNSTSGRTLNILKSVNATVTELAETHLLNWAKLVKHPYGIPVSPDDFPFDWYSKYYTVGNNFYLERVINSHIFSLFKYASFYLHQQKGNEDFEEDFALLNKLISKIDSHREESQIKYEQRCLKQKETNNFLKQALSKLKSQRLNYFIDYIYNILSSYIENRSKLIALKTVKKGKILFEKGIDST